MTQDDFLKDPQGATRRVLSLGKEVTQPSLKRPYYDLTSAAQLSKLLLHWRSTGYVDKVLPAVKAGFKVNTLRNFLYAAHSYIKDNPTDFPNEVNEASGKLVLSRVGTYGFKLSTLSIQNTDLISALEDPEGGFLVDPEMSTDGVSPSGTIFDEVLAFLNGGDAHYKREGLSLSSEDLNQLHELMKQYPNKFSYKFTADKILLLRL